MTSEKKIRTFHLKKREALYALGTHFLSGRRLYPQPNEEEEEVKEWNRKVGGTEEKYKNPFKTDCKYDITLQEVPQIHLRKRKSVSSEIECSKLTIMVWPGHCVPIFENFS